MVKASSSRHPYTYFDLEIYNFLGIGGDKCDQCTRGYVQEAELTPDHPVLNKTIPDGEEQQCLSCGECFTNWDRILNELFNKTETEVAEANKLKSTGVTGSYYKNYFDSMETMLVEVRSILEGGSISNEELEDVQEKNFKTLRAKLIQDLQQTKIKKSK